MDLLSRCWWVVTSVIVATSIPSCSPGSFEGGCVWECFNDVGERTICGCAEVDANECSEDEARRSVTFVPDEHCTDIGFPVECETEEGETYFSSERCF